MKFKVGDKVRVTERKNGHEFEIGEVVEITDIHPIDNDYRCSNGYTNWYLKEDELKKEGANKMDLKHDGYVVVNLTDCVISVVETKSEAESEVDFYLKDGIDAENILVFPPNSSLPFSHGVKLID